jgi:hypothetical protein
MRALIGTESASERSSREGVSMSAGATYRQHAADCLRLAQLASAPRDKGLLAEMAAMWLRLAEFAETIAVTLPDGDEVDRL